jgi:hypothetical protein
MYQYTTQNLLLPIVLSKKMIELSVLSSGLLSPVLRALQMVGYRW